MPFLVTECTKNEYTVSELRPLRQKLHSSTIAEQSMTNCEVKGMQNTDLEWKPGEEHHD